MQAALGAQFSFGRGDLGGHGQGRQERDKQRDEDMHGYELLLPPTAGKHSIEGSIHQSGGLSPRTWTPWPVN